MSGERHHRKPTWAAVAAVGATVVVLVGTAWLPAAAAPLQRSVTAGTSTHEEAQAGSALPAVTRARLVVRPVAPTSASLTRSAAGQRCWSGRAHFESASLAGTTVYSWWQTVRWCSRDGRRISAWRLIDRGGETSTPGWSYAGAGRRGHLLAAGVLRSYTQERFTFSVLWTSYTSTPCAQIRATATGRATVSTACGL
mgnify:CR=1 FL=1